MAPVNVEKLEDRSLLTPAITIRFERPEVAGEVSSIDEWSPLVPGSQRAFFFFHIDEPPTSDLVVPYTISGSATNGPDYYLFADTGTAFFAAGMSEGAVSLSAHALPDAIVEGDETIICSIASTNDYNGGSRTLTIRDNLAPNAADDLVSVVHDRSITIPISDLLANDTDPELHPRTFATLGSATNGTAVLNGSGGVVFTPNPGFVTTPTDIAKFTYTVTDGAMTSNTATVTVNVTNQAPVANNDSGYSVLHDQSINISAGALLANDTDADEDSLKFVYVSATNGTVSQNTNDNGTPGDTSDDFIDSIVFVPTPNYSGPASVSYRANDGIANSNIATVAIDVTNHDATADSESGTLPHSTPLVTQTWDSSALYCDEDGDAVTVTITVPPTKGTVVDNGDGTFTYTANVSQIGTDSFTFSVTDSVIGTTPQSETVTLELTNNAPVPIDDVFFIPIASPATVTIPAKFNDFDPDGDSFTIVSVSSVGDGTATTDGTNIYYDPPIDPSGGTVEEKTELYVELLYVIRDACGTDSLVQATIKNQVVDVLTGYRNYSRGNDDPTEHIYETANIFGELKAKHSTNTVAFKYVATTSSFNPATGNELKAIIDAHRVWLQKEAGTYGTPVTPDNLGEELAYTPGAPPPAPDPIVGGTGSATIMLRTFAEGAGDQTGTAVIQERVTKANDGITRYGRVRQEIEWKVKVTGSGADKRFTISFTIKELPAVLPPTDPRPQRIPTPLRKGKYDLYRRTDGKGTKQTPYPASPGIWRVDENMPSATADPVTPPPNWNTFIPNDG